LIRISRDEIFERLTKIEGVNAKTAQVHFLQK